MVKIHFQKNNQGSSISNKPIKFGAKKSVELDIPDEDYEKIMTGTHALDVDKDNKVTLTEIPPRPESDIEKAKKALKIKLEAGTATDEDIKEGLKLLLS